MRVNTVDLGYAAGPKLPSGRSIVVERTLGHLLWVLTLVLIFMGALVKSHEAGLSVPDWPTTYGQNMFLFPPSEWRANVFYDHTHRLAASLVGLLTLLFCVRLLFSERRVWVKVCGAAAVAIVIAQGVLGGLTVRYLLPASLSVAHGILAQTFLLLAVFLHTCRVSASRRFYS
jgi:cytochrome c oxidase assembly protein subunit 15